MRGQGRRRVRVQEGRQDRQRHPAKQHHPAGQRVLRERRLPLAQQHGAECPQDRRRKNHQRAGRRRADVADVVAEKDRHGDHAQRESDGLAPVELLVQHRHRDQRRPDRHRVGDDRAASRRKLLHAEQHEAVPAGDVEKCERRQASPPRARNADGLAAPAGDQEHAQRRDRQRDGAKCQRRDLGDADLEHRPVAAPYDRQQQDRHDGVRQRMRVGTRR